MDIGSYEKTIEALTLISRAITSDQYIEDILRLIVIVTAKVMNSEVCSLWLLDEKAKTLRIRATQSIDSDYIKERSVGLGEGVLGMWPNTTSPTRLETYLKSRVSKKKSWPERWDFFPC